MSKIYERAKAQRAAQEIVTPYYRRWLVESGESAYSDEIAAWIAEQLRKKGRDRRASFSASSGGSCMRAQQLQFLGAPATYPITPELQNLFNDGKWRHLRWQAALMMQGIMTEAEVPLLWKKKNLVGSADGKLIIPEDHPNPDFRGAECGFELKGMSPFLWKEKEEMFKDGFPHHKIIKEEHLSQVSRYSLISGWDLFSVVYENKMTQEWLEFTIRVTQKMLDVAEKEVQQLNDATNREYLFEKLDPCKKNSGRIFEGCSFGGSIAGACVQSRDWPTDTMRESWRKSR